MAMGSSNPPVQMAVQHSRVIAAMSVEIWAVGVALPCIGCTWLCCMLTLQCMMGIQESRILTGSVGLAACCVKADSLRL